MSEPGQGVINNLVESISEPIEVPPSVRSTWNAAIRCNLGESAQIHLLKKIERIGLLEAFHSFTFHRTAKQCNFYILKILLEVRTLGAYTLQCKCLCAPPRKELCRKKISDASGHCKPSSLAKSSELLQGTQTAEVTICPIALHSYCPPRSIASGSTNARMKLCRLKISRDKSTASSCPHAQDLGKGNQEQWSA